MKGLYFYKLVSPYKEDVTKDCKLTINEIDSNFITLKDADIKDFVFNKENKQLTIIRNNGDKLMTDLSSLDKTLSVDYDSKEGKITLTHGNEVHVIEGLITKDNIGGEILTEVIIDDSLMGNGTCKKPLGIKQVEKTGHFKTCIEYRDLTSGNTLPDVEYVKQGARYITKENVSNFGYLYDYHSVKRIEEDLNCGWRIPTKADWDNMLNAIEPCEAYKNHNSTLCNRELGMIAGKLLKSQDYWKTEVKVSKNNEKELKPISSKGVDWYGMRVLPSGYGDGNQMLDYFASRCGYWTATENGNTDIYVKRFDYKLAGVEQIAENPRALYSIRLVKDYNGNNFNESEIINGQVYSCKLMPSDNTTYGLAIWTSVNIAFNDTKYKPHAIATTDETAQVYTQKYFICEWTGKSWAKKELHDGDSVTLINGIGEDAEAYDEYRLINGELVSVTSKIYSSVTSQFVEKIETLENEVNELSEQVSALTEDLSNEIERATSAETELANAIESEVERAKNAEEELATAIENEVERATSAETAIAEHVDALETKVNENEGRLISQEGTQYNHADGVLTLNTVNPDNAITINFNSNYGNF